MEIIEGIITYDNDANGYFYEWWMLDDDRSNEWLQHYRGKKVRITIEIIGEKMIKKPFIFYPKWMEEICLRFEKLLLEDKYFLKGEENNGIHNR